MVIYRTLLPAERTAYRDHLLRLSPDDRYARFHGPANDGRIERHFQAIDWPRTLVLGAFVGGVLRGAAELCFTQAAPGADIEIGVSVEEAAQGHGVGTRLIAQAMLMAQNRSAGRLLLLCLPENRRMQRIIRRLDGMLTYDPSDVEGVIRPGRPNQVSLLQEWIAECGGWWGAALARWQDAAANGNRLIPVVRTAA